MSGFPLDVNMSDVLDLPDGYVIEWGAIDATGADVAGVVVEEVSIFGTALGAAAFGGSLAGDPILIGTSV